MIPPSPTLPVPHSGTPPPYSDSGQLPATVAAGRPERFTFDRVFSPDVRQAEVYDVVGAPILESVLAGFNGCILAYGQVRRACG